MSDKYAAVTTPRLLPLSRVREIANGSQLLMGEAADLAKTAIQLTEELSIATDSFQDAGRRLFQADERIAELLAEREADKARIAELENYRAAYLEWHDKTEWVQQDKRFDVLIPWGKHRADVLKEYIYRLESLRTNP